MQSSEAVGYGFIFLGAAIMWFSPLLLLRRNKKLSGKELAEAHPELSWVRYGYPILSLVWLSSSVLGTLALSIHFSPSHPERAGYFVAAALASVAILNGLFAVLTGVCPGYTQKKSYYVYDNQAKTAGVQLISLGVAIIVIFYSIAYFW